MKSWLTLQLQYLAKWLNLLFLILEGEKNHFFSFFHGFQTMKCLKQARTTNDQITRWGFHSSQTQKLFFGQEAEERKTHTHTWPVKIVCGKSRGWAAWDTRLTHAAADIFTLDKTGCGSSKAVWEELVGCCTARCGGHGAQVEMAEVNKVCVDVCVWLLCGTLVLVSHCPVLVSFNPDHSCSFSSQSVKWKMCFSSVNPGSMC